MMPHNMTMTVTGAGMLWVGWFGFNGGSALAADGSAGMAVLVTHVSAGSVWPWLRAPLPASSRRRVVCVFQVMVLVACIPPMLPAPVQVSLLAAGLAALIASFAWDVLLLRAAGRKRRAGDAEGAAGSAYPGA